MGLTAEPLSDKERKFLKNKNAGLSEQRRGSIFRDQAAKTSPSNSPTFGRDGRRSTKKFTLTNGVAKMPLEDYIAKRKQVFQLLVEHSDPREIDEWAFKTEVQ